MRYEEKKEYNESPYSKKKMVMYKNINLLNNYFNKIEEYNKDYIGKKRLLEKSSNYE